MVLIAQVIGYVVSMSLFIATIHKTKYSKAQGVSVEFMDVPPLDLIGVSQIISA